MRPEDPELAGLIQQYVPLRIVNMKGVDLSLFRFDYDLTFAVLLMGPDGRTYARYGSQDHRSTADRMSIPGLKKEMREVLTLHKGAKPASPAPAGGKPFTIADYPGFARTRKAREDCYHCHYANDARFRQLRLEGKFTKAALFQYPLPENVGIALDVDRNNEVKSVLPDSAAAKAGIRAGDRLLSADGHPVLTPADIQFRLNEIPDPGSVRLRVERGGRPLPEVTLQLPKGWRKTDISWRPSQGEVPPQLGMWGRPLNDEEKRQRGLRPDRMAIQVNFFFPGPHWARTRGDLKNGDVLLGLDGEDLPAMTTRQFHSHYRLKYNVGDTARLNVLRGGRRVEIPVPCLDVPEE